MSGVDLQTFSHIKEYIQKAWTKHSLNDFPSTAHTLTEQLLSILAAKYQFSAWSCLLSPQFAADLIEAIWSFHEHEWRKWFVSSVFFKANRNLDTTTIFWEVSPDKQAKYIRFAQEKASIIDTSLTTSRVHEFLREDQQRQTPGGVKLNPDVSVSISWLSSNGLLDEAWALVGAFAHQNKLGIQDERVQLLIHDNRFLPLLMGIMYYNNIEQK